MHNKTTIITILCAILYLSGCSAFKKKTSNKFSHPGYSTISSNATIATLPLGYNLIIHNQKIMSEKLIIQRSYLHDNLVVKLDSFIIQVLQESILHPLAVLPDSTYSQLLPNESFNISRNIYLKTQWPAQGVELISTTGTVPDYILFFHEVNIGLGLSSQLLYDYTLSNKESDLVSQDLSIVITWSLWDNKKQQYVGLGTRQTKAPATETPLDLDAIKMLLKATLIKIIHSTPLSEKEGLE